VTTTDPWVPLSRRTAGLGPETTLYDGVPKHLRGALTGWFESCWPEENDEHRVLYDHLLLRLHVDHLAPGQMSEDELLDAVDAMLAWGPSSKDYLAGRVSANVSRGHLKEILRIAASTWRVRDDGRGLERRVDDTVTAAVQQAVRTARDDAAAHLAAAWSAVYGRNPDPDRAYDEAVLAVEAVACPLICPNNGRRTLGTVIADLRNQTARWELVIGDSTGQPAGPERLVEMLSLLWQGQSRHAGAPNSRRQNQAEAEAAVHLAATVVQWFTAGVLRRRTP
jgi:hypothetical protein